MLSVTEKPQMGSELNNNVMESEEYFSEFLACFLMNFMSC